MSADLLLLSGGIDSACLAVLRPPKHAAVVDYGQAPADGEVRAASAIAAALSIPLTVVRVDCSSTGSGLLARTAASPIAPSREWWPYRNQLLVTLAGHVALGEGCDCITLASVSTDSFHSDGRPEFYRFIDALMATQEGGIRVAAPVVDRTSVELVRQAGLDDALLGWTHSCHVASFACGLCPGCLKREAVLQAVGRLR